MEAAIPILALGALYMLANQNKPKKQGFRSKYETKFLPNTNTSIKNYPIENKEAVMENLNYYHNPNSSTDKMFNKLRVLSSTGDVVEAITSEAEKKEEKKAKQDKSFLSLTGQKIGEKGFRHNNMQPFFGSNVKQRIGDYESAEGILDHMQGAGSTTINKESMAPLFKPQGKMHWVHGMPSTSDFIQSRQNPSRNMSGVKPWADVQVAPGLNKKEGFYGSGRFNSGMEARERWMPKTVDELRIKTNPKVTYEGVVLGGSARAGHFSRGIQGKVEKNRPDRYFINSPDRWFTTGTAGGEASTSRSIQPDRAVNRPGTSREYFGNSANDIGTYIPGKSEQPKRIITTKKLSLGPADGVSGVWKANGPELHTDDLGRSSFKNRVNARSLTSKNQQFGVVSTYAKAIVAPLMDILRPSRKENTVGTIRPTGNASSTVSQMPVYNPADKLKTTNKETTIDNPNFGGMPNSEANDGYLADMYNQSNKPTPQQRDNTNCEYIPGAGSALHGKARVYNAEYNMHLNADKQVLTQGRSPNGNLRQGLYNGYTNVKIDKMDSDRFNGRGAFSNNSTITSIPSAAQIGKVSQKMPIGVGLGCSRNESSLLNAYNCNPYTHSLHSSA